MLRPVGPDGGGTGAETIIEAVVETTDAAGTGGARAGLAGRAAGTFSCIRTETGGIKGGTTTASGGGGGGVDTSISFFAGDSMDGTDDGPGGCRPEELLSGGLIPPFALVLTFMVQLGLIVIALSSLSPKISAISLRFNQASATRSSLADR